MRVILKRPVDGDSPDYVQSQEYPHIQILKTAEGCYLLAVDEKQEFKLLGWQSPAGWWCGYKSFQDRDFYVEYGLMAFSRENPLGGQNIVAYKELEFESDAPLSQLQ